MITGFYVFSEMLSTTTWGDTHMPPPFVWLFALVFGSYGAIVALSIIAGALSVAGRLLGGRGNARETWRAITWSALPLLPTLPIWLFQIYLLGSRGHRIEGVLSEGPTAEVAVTILDALQLPLGVGQLILLIGLIAEVHRFSVWRALSTVALTWATLGPLSIAVLAILD